MTIPDKKLWLIDTASNIAGSDSKLAVYLDVSRGNVCDWRKHRKSCPLAEIALMAHLSNLCSVHWVVDLLIDEHANTVKGQKLGHAFKIF